MTKLKAPLLSLRASGTIGNQVSYEKRGRLNIARSKPTPAQPHSLLQTYHRWDYQDYCQWWHSLSDTEKQQWETDARPLKITGFNYWMRTRLLTLPDIAARWRMDDISNGKILDSSKNTNTGTVYGASITKGIINNCLLFDGIDDYIEIPSSPTLDFAHGDPWTFECFVKAQGAFRVLIGKYDGAGWLGLADSTTLLSFRDFYGNTYYLSIPSISNIWAHLAIVCTGTLLQVFTHGVFRGNITPVSTAFRVDRVAGNIHAHYSIGNMDEPTMRNRQLDPTDIQRHAARRFPLTDTI